MGTRLLEDRLLSRATFGARRGDRETLHSLGAKGWLERELGSGTSASENPVHDPELRNRLNRFPSLLRSARELLAEAALDDEPMMGRGPGAKPSKEQRREFMQLSRRIGREAAGARVVRAVHGKNGLREGFILPDRTHPLRKGSVLDCDRARPDPTRPRWLSRCADSLGTGSG